MTDIVKHHLRRVLEASLNVADDEQDRAEKLERTGHRIVSGGQVSRDRWEITDWRTGEMIAQSDGGIDEYEAALDRLDPDGMWFDAGGLTAIGVPFVRTPGIPASLGEALEEWMGTRSVTDEEIAELIGWPVEKVAKQRPQ